MNEQEVIKQSEKAYTKEMLVDDLRKLGVKSGDCLLVHSSLSRLGWVVGGAISVVSALLEAVGESGSIVMPCFSGDNSDPKDWQNPPVPKSWWSEIRLHMPAFDPLLSPTRQMGKIVDLFRHYPGVKRSYHPQVSFCGYGKFAWDLLEEHPLSPGFGEDSPLQKLYHNKAKVLLLGVEYENCTCMHLGEVWNKEASWHQTGSRISVDNQSVWVEYSEISYDDSDFIKIGEDYEKNHQVTKQQVGQGEARLLDIQSISDFAYQWMIENRKKY